MKTKLIFPLIVIAFVACGSDEKTATQQAANYETVQEGSAAGVTSTIHGPGEIVPPMPQAMTGTNADTTTAFTLNPNAVPAATQQPAGGTIAGTLPAGSYYPTPAPSTPSAAGTTYRAPVTRTSAQRVSPAASQPASQPMYSSSSPSSSTNSTSTSTSTAAAAPAPQPTEAEPQPAQPDTSAATTTTQAPPPPTQTAPPAQQPKQEKKEGGEQKPPADGGEDAETTETAPPPPPRF